MSKIYFVNISVTPLKEGMDMVLFVSKLAGLVQNYSNHTKILHKFKVTGEPQIVAIIEVADVIGLERTIAGLYRLGNVSVTCTPLYCYEDFANFLGVGPITFPGPLPENDLYWLEFDLEYKEAHDINHWIVWSGLPENDLYWLEFDLEYKGKSLDEFVEIWRNEAHRALSSRAEGLPVALYKVLMERKVHVFLCVPDPAKLDEMAFNLPLMVENGENVHIKCKAIQMLDVFRRKVVA